MNHFLTKFAISLLALTMVGSQLQAQFTTTYAKNATPGQQNGMYYSLPQTMLRLDFIIEETRYEKGPLGDYTSNYYETMDYVDYESTEYRIVDVKTTPVACPDPNALFFVTFATGRGSEKVQFEVLPNGIIRSAGVGKKCDDGVDKLVIQKEQPQCNQEPIEPESDFFAMLSLGKSNAQMAKEVVDKIEEIRKAKFYLISGDVEMASNPQTFNAMYQKLDDLEKEYASLLFGKSVSRKMVKTVYVIPNKEVSTQTVAKFSETEGFTVGTSGTGNPIAVQTLSLNTTENINAPSQSAVESMSYENKVFYRVPEMANVKVTCGSATLFEDRMIVNQLGVLLMAPVINSMLEFDTETGQVVNIRMQ